MTAIRLNHSARPSRLKALIFDLDGTLADSEMAHLSAFNRAFAEVGLNWHWDLPLYKQLLRISGGRERLRHYWRSLTGAPSALDGTAVEDVIERVHELKTAAYRDAVQAGEVRLRAGVQPLLAAARREGMRLAIATTTSPANVSVLMERALGPDWREAFDAVEDAGSAGRKKPHPQVYLQALQRLGLPAGECLAVEDSENGLRAALAAGLPTLVTPNGFTADHDFLGALRVLPSLRNVTLAKLSAWHTRAQAH